MSGRSRTSDRLEFPPRFRISVFAVDSAIGTITGPVGAVQVDPKVMDVLVLLARRRGQPVSREELLEACWPGIVVSDDALTRCVYQLRQHLSQAGGQNGYRDIIETLPKRGYRLNCELLMATLPTDSSSLATPNGSEPHRAVRFTSFRVGGLVAVMAGIAVVAMALWHTERGDLGESTSLNGQAYDAYLRGNDYFGRSDSQSALPYAETMYRRAVVLDPSFAPAWAGLARANTDMYWHSIDRTPARLSQAEWALDRLFALNTSLDDAHLAKANYLLKGLLHYEDALNELNKAEASGSTQPELYFLRGMAYRRLGQWKLSIESVNKALELDSDNISYLRQQHVSYLFTRDYVRAEQLLDRILALFPDDGTLYVDRVVLALCRDGDTALAHRYQRNAPSESYDDGLAYTYTSWLAAIYDRDYQRALQALDAATEDPIFDGDMRNSSFGPKVLFYARTHSLAGNDEQARQGYAAVLKLLEARAPEGNNTGDPMSAGELLAFAEAHAALGHPGEALARVRQAREQPTSEAADDLMASALQLESVLRVLIPAGYDEEALRQLDDYLHKNIGHWSIEGLRADPRLDPVRGYAEFSRLEEKYRR